jgi:uncharacterized membrane protein
MTAPQIMTALVVLIAALAVVLLIDTARVMYRRRHTR